MEEDIVKELEKVESHLKKMKETSSREWNESYKDFEAIAKYQELTEKLREIRKKKKRANPVGCHSDHSAEKDLFEKPFEEKIKRIGEYLTLAENSLEEGDTNLAAALIEKARLWLSYTFPNEENQDEKNIFSSVQHRTNLVLAHIKFEEDYFHESLHICNKVDPTPDIQLLKARCLVGIGNYLEAESILQTLRQADVDVLLKEEVLNEIREIRERKIQDKASEHEMVTKMFSE